MVHLFKGRYTRWYSGSGIYRDVHLYQGKEEYICTDGVRITTMTIDPPRLSIKVDAVKKTDTKILIEIIKDGEVIGTEYGTDVIMEIPNARLWSAESPDLYKVRTALVCNDQVIDEVISTTGIRKISWNSHGGFLVNNQPVKLRGGCVHHDHGVIGAAEYDDACIRKVKKMKEAGFNAVRISHNPASKSMLRACDMIGIYVMNESFDTWYGLKSPYDYAMYFDEECEKDIKDMVRVSYNHPSVVMYSIGNEVYLKNLDTAVKTTNRLINACKKIDESRPFTNAINPITVMMADNKNPEKNRYDQGEPRKEGNGSGISGSKLANTIIDKLDLIMKVIGSEKNMRKYNKVFEPLDIVGFNYGNYLYEKQNKDYPGRILLGTETFPQTIYENWGMVQRYPYLAGDFLWTAWDYMGESGIGAITYGKKGAFTRPFPTIGSSCGNIDLCGEIKCQGYYTSIVYGTYDRPYIGVHPVIHSGEKTFLGTWSLTDTVHSWSWAGCEGSTAYVEVYSNAAEVELFFNEVSLGRKLPEKCMAAYEVIYEPGLLRAVHFDDAGNEIGADALVSADSTIKLTLKTDDVHVSAKDKKLIYVSIEVTDNNGIRKILDERNIDILLSGPARLIGFGNSNPEQTDLMPFTKSTTSTFEGRALAVLRLNGNAGKVEVIAKTSDVNEEKISIIVTD